MDKKILYLSFYYYPDLSAGSFRNTPLSEKLANEFEGEVHVMTTQPNRYSSFRTKAPSFEERGNLKVFRFPVPEHKSGFIDQIKTYFSYFKSVRKEVRKNDYDLVFVSTGRLFSGFLGALISRKKQIPLYLDIRDVFLETIEDVVSNRVFKAFGVPVIRLIESYTLNSAKHVNVVSEGFLEYFSSKYELSYSFYPNGIDDLFMNAKKSKVKVIHPSIVYAGNIGDSQGLDKILVETSTALDIPHEFIIIGDGGAKEKLIEKMRDNPKCKIRLVDPVQREQLLIHYSKASILFLHLNDLPAFERVLPSKLFEYGALDKPIIAGLSGYSAQFVRDNIEGAVVFEPCSVKGLVSAIQQTLSGPAFYNRNKFRQRFDRKIITSSMAESILNCLKN